MATIENEIKKYLDTIGQNYSKFLLCYNLFHQENKSRAPNKIGQKEAEKNVAIMNKYNSIFSVLDFGMLDLAIYELSKIFEKQSKRYINKTISLITLMSFLKEHKDEINKHIKKIFDKKCHELKDSQLNFLSIEEIRIDEGGEKILDDDFFNKINLKIKKIEYKIGQLKNSRDNRGHNLDILKTTKLSYDDLDNIKDSFFEIFNIINSHLGNGVYDYSFYYKDTESDYNLLLSNLKEFYDIRSLFFDNYLNKQGKTDEDIIKEIKSILKINF